MFVSGVAARLWQGGLPRGPRWKLCLKARLPPARTALPGLNLSVVVHLENSPWEKWFSCVFKILPY